MSKITVIINDLTLCHKACNGIAQATLPDVCLTPAPGGPVRIPYPNIALSTDLSNGTKTVEVDGGNMAAVKGSQFSFSTGDEPGTVGGIKSGTNMKEAKWLMYSPDVKMEGRNACRLTDKMTCNRGNTACLAGEQHAANKTKQKCRPTEEVVQLIRKEMERNRESAPVKEIGALIKQRSEIFSAPAFPAATPPESPMLDYRQQVFQSLTVAAYKKFFDLVAPGRLWDHKGWVLKIFGKWTCDRRVDGEQIQKTAYNYQIWSNMHYGYIGRASGFTEDELLEAAGGGQLLTFNVSKEYWQRVGDEGVFASFDTASDQISIKAGFDLWNLEQQSGQPLRGQAFDGAILEVLHNRTDELNKQTEDRQVERCGKVCEK